MKKITLLTMLFILLTGCVSTKKMPLDVKITAKLKNQTVMRTERPVIPDFSAATVGRVSLGLFGVAAMINEGNEIIRKNNVMDPANAIASSLLEIMQKDLGANVSASIVKVYTNDADQLAKASKGQAAFTLDVETRYWTVGYFSTDWTHYWVHYIAKARLIEVETGSVVAEGTCNKDSKSDEKPPSYEELQENQAAILKQKLISITNECVKTFKTEMLAL